MNKETGYKKQKIVSFVNFKINFISVDSDLLASLRTTLSHWTSRFSSVLTLSKVRQDSTLIDSCLPHSEKLVPITH